MEAALLRDETRDTWKRLEPIDRLRTILIGPKRQVIRTIKHSAAIQIDHSSARPLRTMLDNCEL